MPTNEGPTSPDRRGLPIPEAGCAIFTICAKNYLHFARVWARSVAKFHPEAKIYIFLSDRIDDYFDVEMEPFSVIPASSLNIKEFNKLCFRYDILEFSTSIKPFCFSYLMDIGYRKVIYMDPDTFVYAPMREVIECLETGAQAVLTPHVLVPSENPEPPNDLTFLRAGIYNLGFVALRKTNQVRELVGWSERRLERHCVSDRVDEGIFVDQKWMDLWPAYCPGTVILDHPGYNVAYWNLDGRKLRLQDRAATVNGQPLVFFHYSGLVPGNRNILSRYQERIVPADLGQAIVLFETYHDALDANGRADVQNWPYAFGTFANGERIPKLVRRTFRDRLEPFDGDPFCDLSATLNAPAQISPNPAGAVTVLSHHLWHCRHDLRAAFPLTTGMSQIRYSEWFAQHAPGQAELPDFLVAPVTERLARLPARPGALRRGMDIVASRLVAPGRRAGKKLARKAKSRIHSLIRPLGDIGQKAWLGRSVDGEQAMRRGKTSSVRSHRDHAARTRRPFTTLPPSELCDGLCLIGYPRAEIGVGEALRSLARSGIAASIPIDILNFDTHVGARQNDLSLAASTTDCLARRVNVLCINADMLAPSVALLGGAAFDRRYNIVRPFWELSRIHPLWIDAIDRMDEVWAPTRFVADAFAASVRRPVVHIPVSVNPLPPANPSRTRFALPDGAFLFLFAFDFASYSQRKNPFAVVDAFQRAFGASGDPGVGLVIKSMGVSADRDDVLARLRLRVGSDPRVHFIDGTLDRADAIELVAVCDAFVSLHRAEGFGFGMAEAMALGKPVIGTDYSGSSDFLTERTGFPVKFDLVPVRQDDYPYYLPDQMWADPDVGDAATIMAGVYHDREQATSIGQAARSFILEHHSPLAVGRVMSARLRELGLA